jgi:hypothetical protein
MCGQERLKREQERDAKRKEELREAEERRRRERDEREVLFISILL